jgi:signal transduction histidine kinase
MRQIFMNIVRNAIDAVPPGGRIRFHIVASNLRNQPGVRVYISDNGPGVPKVSIL